MITGGGRREGTGLPVQVCKPCGCPASRKKKEPGDIDRVVKTCIWSNISEAKGLRVTCPRVKQPGQQTGHGRHLCYSGKKAAAIYR